MKRIKGLKPFFQFWFIFPLKMLSYEQIKPSRLNRAEVEQIKPQIIFQFFHGCGGNVDFFQDLCGLVIAASGFIIVDEIPELLSNSDAFKPAFVRCRFLMII